MIERVGRRNLYLIGFLGQGLSFVITFAWKTIKRKIPTAAPLALFSFASIKQANVITKLRPWPRNFMIERVGRRNLYLIGFLGQGLSFVITFACLIDATVRVRRGLISGG
jgi:hypothetical protein